MFKVVEWELTDKDVGNCSSLELNVFPNLAGKVFHMTDQKGYEGICKLKFIKHNRDKQFPLSYQGSENSFGRKNG